MRAIDTDTVARIRTAHLVAAVNAAVHGAHPHTIAELLRPTSIGAGYGPWHDIAQRIAINATPAIASDLAEIYTVLVATPTEHGGADLARYRHAETRLRTIRTQLLAPAVDHQPERSWLRLTGGPAWASVLVDGQPVLELLQRSGAPINQIHVTIPDTRTGTTVFEGDVRHLPPGTALPPPARSLLDRVGSEPIDERSTKRPVNAVQLDGYDLAIIERCAATVRVAIYDQQPAHPFLRAEYYLLVNSREHTIERYGLDSQPNRIGGLGR